MDKVEVYEKEQVEHVEKGERGSDKHGDGGSGRFKMRSGRKRRKMTKPS